MKIKSLLLGSAAMLVVSTPAFSAELLGDFGLGTCDALGISGLTLESDDNCLAISGGVDYEFSVGDYADVTSHWAGSHGPASADDLHFDDDDGDLDSESSIGWWLQFVATADSDFGAAKAWIKFVDNGSVLTGTTTAIDGVEVDEAAVSIGSETLTLIFGKTGSIFNDGNDEPLNYLGLILSEMVDTGVGFSTTAATGGQVIQAVMAAGDGITVMVGLEDLQSGSTGSAGGTLVGTLEVDQDWGSANVSFAYDDVFDPATNIWNMQAGITLEMEMATLVAALATDSAGYWNALFSASTDLDIFTLAGSSEFDSYGQVGFGGSIEADVADGVSLALGARYFDNPNDAPSSQIGGRIIFDVSDNLTATGEAGVAAGDGAGPFSYVSGELAWAPGGDFEAAIKGEANSAGGYKLTTTASKSFD
jgi:porin-like protein